MQQAERIKRGGHAQPDDTHLSHGKNTLKSNYIRLKLALLEPAALGEIVQT